MPLVFCPNCSNALTISRADSTTQYPMGVNRFECRTCPYEWVLDKKWFDKTEVKEKEVEEVFGGKDEWKNADSVATQCPAEGCNGERAYFYQLQIRSADEPMTTFLRVGVSLTYPHESPHYLTAGQCTTCATQWREN
ncbi:RNA polymerase III subunit C11 [Penicillium hispanicum]|uniref:RNA polymerase III subunit C11 n=1 Tax=Penicillium hispanicum TaxID=1080232 RepID=UPI00253FA05F|nr:RNA polymerase III subunit C11 [Penicillium hispanicum]KAJ5585188.1 RNA polymerase III subunit C11 [Penicillium hispanicum]